jgi:hypothetical protein
MGGFPEELKYGEDQYLWGKISLKYPVVYSWKGLTLYHTDARGRICDEIHGIQEHPFSVYLKQELAAGAVPAEKLPECRAYIRRKRYTEIFSRLVSGDEPASCEPLKASSTGSGEAKNTSKGSMKIIGRSLTRFYHSSVHDMLRLALCKIYGCYNPGRAFAHGIRK